MIKNRCALVILALLLGGYSVYMPTSPWTIASISMTAAILAFVLKDAICREIKRRKRNNSLQDPFEIYDETGKGNKRKSCLINASPKMQEIKITLKVKTEVNIKFMNIAFDNNDSSPIIKGLYDWNFASFLTRTRQIENIRSVQQKSVLLPPGENRSFTCI